MKVNFDGAMFPKSNEAGVGVVIQNEAGEVLATLAEKIHQPYTMETVEIIAVRRAVLFSARLGFLHPIFKGDSEVIIKVLSEDILSFSNIVMPQIFFFLMIITVIIIIIIELNYYICVHNKMRVDNFVVL